MNHREVHEEIWKVFDFIGEDHPVPWGSSVRKKRELIPILFANLSFHKGAEIGVQRGNFSKQICEANRNVSLICVDPWMPNGKKYTQERQDRLYTECVNNLKDYDVTILKKTSMEAVKEIQLESLDFVYIDGNHHFNFVMEDIIHWSERVRPGGIVACHDYHYATNGGVIYAVNAYTQAHHIDPWYVTKEAQPTAYWVKP